MTYHYPFDHPGSTGSDTSDAGAAKIAPVRAEVQRKVLRALADAGERGLTAHEVAATLGMQNTTTQPRLTELSLMDMVGDSGMRRQNKSGVSARVWTINAKGLASIKEVSHG